MTRTLTFHLVAFSLVMAAPAFAQDLPSFTGIFVSDASACQSVATGELVSPDFTVFEPAKGISTMDFHCDFVDIKQNGPDGWYVATAFCEEPGFQYPDMFTFAQQPGGEVTVKSLSGAILDHSNVDSVSLADGTYLQCEAPAQ